MARAAGFPTSIGHLQISMFTSETVKRAKEIGSFLGAPLFLLACAALGIVEIIFGQALPQLHAWGQESRPIAIVAGAILACLAFWLLIRPSSRIAAIGLAGHWCVAAIFAVAAALAEPANLVSWVPVTQTIVFALAGMRSLSLARTDALQGSDAAFHSALGLMLLFFGLVHIVHREMVAGLIPSWIPGQGSWLWVTALVMILAGAAMLARSSQFAGITIACMFASWIVLVHVPRIAEHPESQFEWSFALTAMALIGVALMAGADQRLRSSPRLRP